MTDAGKSLEKGLISVVMSNYNTPSNYLRMAIESVLNQTYTNFEFIIIDDGSTDGSLEVIRSYDDPRIVILCNEKNIGLTRSLNKGFELCRGEYIARMDADDICHPERFEKQLSFMREHPDVIVCGSLAKYINEESKYTGIERHFTIPEREAYRVYLLFGNCPYIMHPSAFFNHSLLLKYHIKYNENYRYAQDYRMWVDCSQKAECAIVPEYLLKYRVHQKAITQEKRHIQNECAYRIIQEQLEALHLSLSDELMPLHSYFLTSSEKPYDVRLIKWMRKIISANRKHHVLSQKLLKQLLYNRLCGICYSRLSKSSSIVDFFVVLSTVPIHCIWIMIKEFTCNRFRKIFCRGKNEASSDTIR